MSDNIQATIQKTGTVIVEFTVGPLIMFWALQRIRSGKKLDDWSGNNDDAQPDVVSLDPVTIQVGDTYPYSMAVFAPASDVSYDAIVRIIQGGKTIQEHHFKDTLAANKAVNCAGTITFVVTQ